MASTRTDMRTDRDSEELATQVENLQRDLREMSKTVTKLASGKVEAVKDEALDTARQAEDMVRSNPLAAVAITLGLGFIVGMMSRR